MGNRLKKRECVFHKADEHCYYCGCKLQREEFHMDHFVPKSKGGKGGDNLVPSCPDCNEFKAALEIEDFRKKIDNLFSSSIEGKIIAKYFNIERKRKEFYFEERENRFVK